VYAEFVGYIDPSSFDVSQSLSIITIVVVGGLGNLWGTLGAAIVLTFLPQLLLLVPSASNAAAQLQLVLYGVILVVIVRFWPRGIIPERPSVQLPRHMRTREGEPPTQSSTATLERLDAITVNDVLGTAPAVHVLDVKKSFGGVQAVDGVSLEIEPGRVTALIGPNGAGKTTLFNLMCGLVRAESGRIHVGSVDTTGATSYEIARLGVTRTFQDVRIFPRLTVLEHLVFARSSLRAAPRGALVDRAWETARDLGLDAYSDTIAGDLSYAQQKLLMMGLVLVREDAVVFLDEIAAGLDHTSVGAVARLIRRIAASGRTVCLVEHNLAFVWDAADVVFVLDAGRVIAAGPPSVIQSDPHVTEIYFGQQHSTSRS
jgi:branched-chain amino acid transport system permease protein